MRINYNVTGSKRKELVQAVADFLAVHPVYLGAPTFAYKVGGCQVDVHGILTTPDTCDEVAAALLDTLKQRGFEPFHDEEPASTVETAPTGTEDYSYIVEIPKNGFTPEAEDNLARIIASKATLLKKALGTDTLEVIQTETTLKFPWFTLHNLDEEADAYNRLITAICKMAKEQRRVTAVERPTGNEKFTMRIFLIRLGFVGDDYKKREKSCSGTFPATAAGSPDTDRIGLRRPPQSLLLKKHQTSTKQKQLRQMILPMRKGAHLMNSNGFPSRKTVAQVRQMYPPGCRVELISMDDPYSKLKPGDRGTVRTVDDTGTVFVRWDNGSGLGVVYGVDRIRKL